MKVWRSKVMLYEAWCLTYRSAPGVGHAFSVPFWNSPSSAVTLRLSLGTVCLPSCRRRRICRDRRPSRTAAKTSSWRFSLTLTNWTSLARRYGGSGEREVWCVYQCWGGITVNPCVICRLDPAAYSWLTFLSEHCCMSAIGCCSYQALVSKR